jgi:hypothetical protein
MKFPKDMTTVIEIFDCNHPIRSLDCAFAALKGMICTPSVLEAEWMF